ncbi:RagB/SusD family nutrient uptake outer membrane protein [Formosa undariae]|uniref:RagB/SusD family nutrient uptake outer membrane protein n=1 Tax=Formosa undariae TaxID=1325436 RepID=A0ABV5F467_9FLAO
MKAQKYSLLLLIFVTAFISCSDDYLVEDPRTDITANNLFESKSGFEVGLNGLYTHFRRERGGDNYNSTNDLLIDPAVTGTDNMFGNERSGWARGGNELNDRNTPISNEPRRLMQWLYELNNATNTIIDRAENPSIDWTEAEKNAIVAEARLFRAWGYRHLTYLFGDVPLHLEESSGANIITGWERTPVAEIREVMEADLLFAEAYLPETQNDGGKVVKGVATHYLAELYLAMGRDEDALAKAKDLIDNGPFSLITSRYGVKAGEPGTPFTDMFIDGNSNKSEGNTEALWVMQHELEVIGGGRNIMRRWHRGRSQDIVVDGVSGTIILDAENGGRGLERVSPTRYALELYESSDDRGGRFAWRDYEVLNNPKKIPSGRAIGDTIFFDWRGKDEVEQNNYWPSTRKWDYFNPLDEAGSESNNDQVYLRLGETYLILAEAQMKTGDLAGAAASINALRSRANASLITGADVDIDFILDERSRELYSEEHRKYTLVRLGKWYERFQLYNKVGAPNGDERHTLLPIPQEAIDANSIPMEQNPGYN